MNVGIYSPGYPLIGREGGIGTYTYHLAHGLAGLGHEVHVLTPGLASPVCSDGGVTVHLTREGYFPIVDRIVPGAGSSCKIGAAMMRLVSRHRLDVVEFPNYEGHALWYARSRPAPLVVRLHTSSLESQGIDGIRARYSDRWDVRRERWSSLAADLLVTHSLAHRERMADELSIDPRRIAVVPHGITVYPDFRRPPAREDELTVVYLGRMERRKGTMDLLLAIPDVLREVPRARFVLIGTDRAHCPGGRTHARFVEEEFPAQVRERIRFEGHLPAEEVVRRLQSADLFVAPSVYESFGLVFLEAMRWGTPAIGTTAGGIPEIIQEGESGMLVSPNDPDALASAMITLLKDDGLRHRIGQAGRRRVETMFSPEIMAGRVADLYGLAAQRSAKGLRSKVTLPGSIHS
jgi:glycosyltransferase involved in cell wall biosynthesis